MFDHWYPSYFGISVMSGLSIKARVDPSLACNGFLSFTSGNTCWLHTGQHGSQAFSTHVIADTYIHRHLGGGALSSCQVAFTPVGVGSWITSKCDIDLVGKSVKVSWYLFFFVFRPWKFSVCLRWQFTFTSLMNIIISPGKQILIPTNNNRLHCFLDWNSMEHYRTKLWV